MDGLPRMGQAEAAVTEALERIKATDGELNAVAELLGWYGDC